MAIAAPAWWRSKASACWRRAASASRRAGMKVKTPIRSRQDRAQDGFRLAGLRSAGAQDVRTIRISKFWNWADRMGVEVGRFPRSADSPAADRSHPAMAVNLDACIQCNLCVRACREVQVNDVIGMAGPRPSREDRVRLRRSDGQLDLRRLRRMRAGLSDRRPDAVDFGRRRTTCAPNIPTARSTACARIAASAASSPTTSRTTS